MNIHEHQAKKILKEFFEQNRDLEVKNIKHKFRNKQQFLIQW